MFTRIRKFENQKAPHPDSPYLLLLQVDHKTVALPFLKEPHIYLERKSNTILLNTNVGMKVHGGCACVCVEERERK